MGIHVNRKKKRHFLLSFFYKLDKIVFLKNKTKLKLYLDLEWIFNRLSHEYSFKNYQYDIHPIRLYSVEFITKNISNSEKILDLGCKQGDIARIISSKAKYVLGIDYDENAIPHAKQKHKDIENLQFICTEAYTYLDNTDEKFDILILSHILEHLANPI